MIRLTRRQAEIAAMLATNPKLTYREIGARLGISPKTAKVHVTLVASQLSSDYPAKAAVAMLGRSSPPDPDHETQSERLAAVLAKVREVLP